MRGMGKSVYQVATNLLWTIQVPAFTFEGTSALREGAARSLGEARSFLLSHFSTKKQLKPFQTGTCWPNPFHLRGEMMSQRVLHVKRSSICESPSPQHNHHYTTFPPDHCTSSAIMGNVEKIHDFLLPYISQADAYEGKNPFLTNKAATFALCISLASLYSWNLNNFQLLQFDRLGQTWAAFLLSVSICSSCSNFLGRKFTLYKLMHFNPEPKFQRNGVTSFISISINILLDLHKI